ncbi:hypothetical protein ACFQ14_14135 [Pseudahrensia aquimaris]|uniref:Uncharacterized protein n=1 Tax=Pseudahrensia aquimaris TaxID=744461 RepID=A0ABW3FLC7_9HYPH
MDRRISDHDFDQGHAVEKRSPDCVMRLSRMGSFHQSRLSFMRVLLRRLKQQNWSFDRPIWRIDESGVGVATYRAKGPERCYTLIAFAHDLPPEKRSDRVIADAWDATFTLFDGEPTEADIQRLSGNVPRQEAGRISEQELVLSRANRSVRLFDHVRSALAKGEQPDVDVIESVGYLMRTTAVYGAGKFGAADRSAWHGRPEFAGSFQPELLSVFLIRAFTLDLVEHLAACDAPQTAVAVDPDLRRRFGVGNSTGLGMAPFLINHPALIHSWIDARETALARVRSLENVGPQKLERLSQLCSRALVNVQGWNSDHLLQIEKIDALRADLMTLIEAFPSIVEGERKPFDTLHRWAETSLSLEGQEQLVSLMIEVNGDLVDDLAASMMADEQSSFRIDGSMSVTSMRTLMNDAYGWAQEIDYGLPDNDARVWYVSEEKLEPRLGERHWEDVADYEQPLQPGRDAARMMADLSHWDGGARLAAFLLQHPEHRHIARRAQRAALLAYAEIRDNTISSTMLPIDLLRCKLSFFGATKFDPRSDRWVRITMFQGAPFPYELTECDPDDMAYPPVEGRLDRSLPTT